MLYREIIDVSFEIHAKYITHFEQNTEIMNTNPLTPNDL
jgi:hypothetical protein